MNIEELQPSDLPFGRPCRAPSGFENGTVALTQDIFDGGFHIMLHRRKRLHMSDELRGGWDSSDDGVGGLPLTLDDAVEVLTHNLDVAQSTFALITDAGVTRSDVPAPPPWDDDESSPVQRQCAIRSVLAHLPVGYPLVTLNEFEEPVAATIRTDEGWITTANSRTFNFEWPEGTVHLGGLRVIAVAAEYLEELPSGGVRA